MPSLMVFVQFGDDELHLTAPSPRLVAWCARNTLSHLDITILAAGSGWLQGRPHRTSQGPITTAATTRVTAKPGNRGGMGLMSVLGSVRWACSNANRAGHMEVWSGDWRLRFDHRSTDSASYAFKARRLRGTIVLLDLPVA